MTIGQSSDPTLDRPFVAQPLGAPWSEVMVVDGRPRHLRIATPPAAPPERTSADDRLRLRLEGRTEPARFARHEVTRHCSDRVPVQVLHDVQLVVSELVTNSIEHGGTADGLTVEVVVRPREVGIVVTGAGDHLDLPHRRDWTLPNASATTGRGLALVRQVADGVLVDGDRSVAGRPGWLAVTASVAIRCPGVAADDDRGRSTPIRAADDAHRPTPTSAVGQAGRWTDPPTGPRQ